MYKLHRQITREFLRLRMRKTNYSKLFKKLISKLIISIVSIFTLVLGINADVCFGYF